METRSSTLTDLLVYRIPADGGIPPAPLFGRRIEGIPSAWTPEGELLFVRPTADTGVDLWLAAPQEGERPWRRSPFLEAAAEISPDGRLVAYTSSDTGRFTVVVQPLEPGGGRVQVSPQGGLSPRWGRDGELFYQRDDEMMRVAISTGPGLTAGAPQPLFRISTPSMTILRSWDYDPVRDRFLVPVLAHEEAPRAIRLVLGWLAEVERTLTLDREG